MRSYPVDSPQAAARIVASTLVADGHVDSVELNALERAGAYEQLGLTRGEMHAVLRDYCEDLLQSHHGQWPGGGQIDTETLHHLMAEVEDVALRKLVLRLCVAVAEADNHVADGESMVLVSAVERWGLHHQMLQPSA
jgi:Tellurite resistance protein TerB